MTQEIGCLTCKHSAKKNTEAPCNKCCFDPNHRYWEPEEQESRPKILPKVVPHYEWDNSRIPEQIRVSFEDGSTAVYDLHTEQPAPVIMENIRIIRRMRQGYVNQPMRRRGRK